LIAFVSAHAWLAYLTLFLAALLEAVPVVGSLVPGSTIILALSALVPGGELKLWPVLAAAACGAMLGDGTAYLIGYRSQREILSAWPLSNYPRVVAQSEAFFNRWGVLAVFFARFVPPIRAFVPITAGALDMPPARFYAINIPAILLWAPAACAARGPRGHCAARLCRPAASSTCRQASVDVRGGGRRRHPDAGRLDHPPPPWRRPDRTVQAGRIRPKCCWSNRPAQEPGRHNAHGA
jgi:membrane protein DedA with SNARE-associated domain